MYVAFDDTDSKTSMCTTFLATEVVKALNHYDLIGLPRLVRLNPAVPWKTRGNGALCLRFGRGGGNKTAVGRIGGRPVYSFPRSLRPAERQDVLEECSRLLDRWSMIAEDASPGLVVSERPPKPSFYWQAVRKLVDKASVEEELRRINASSYRLAGGRGVIGATAAMAWRPRDRTYEVLVYRTRRTWGKPRKVNAKDVERLDLEYPSTFNNYDHEAGRTAIVPHSSCPILFGVRGDDPDEVVRAAASVRSEPKDRWLLYLSNQGTDDHVIRRWKALEPWSSYQVQGTVIEPPVTIPGGHVLVRLTVKDGGSLDCAAYEPSKGFRGVVRQLVKGDTVTVIGELRERPRTLNIEKLRIESLATVRTKPANPRCPECGKSAHSMGRSGGYRCKSCRKRLPDVGAWATVPRSLQGWYEPPVCSRRHISMPLKRMRQI